MEELELYLERKLLTEQAVGDWMYDVQVVKRREQDALDQVFVDVGLPHLAGRGGLH